MSNGTKLPWFPLKTSSTMCCICGLQEGGPIPLDMSRDPRARNQYVCRECFVCWYEGGGVTVVEIREKRLAIK